MSVRIQVREVDGVSVMNCSGQIILGAASTEFRNCFRELIKNGSTKIVIDLGGVTYLDSTGIGELVGAYTNAYNGNAVVKLCRLPEKIQSLLQITKLVTVFEIHADEAAAITSFKR